MLKPISMKSLEKESKSCKIIQIVFDSQCIAGTKKLKIDYSFLSANEPQFIA